LVARPLSAFDEDDITPGASAQLRKLPLSLYGAKIGSVVVQDVVLCDLRERRSDVSEKSQDRGELWRAFKNVAIIFSFVVNLVLLIVLLALLVPGVRTLLVLRNGLLEPLVTDLDGAFVSLGQATVEKTVQINDSIPISFTLPLNESLPISFTLPIDQPTIVYLTQDVPINAPATFTFPGGGGAINGQVSLALARGMPLPVHLSLPVPVNQTVPVVLRVPVNQMVPIQMDVPVEITLGESGLDPVVGELRQALVPARQVVDRLPGKVLWLP
jgi:hypothetical protein